MTTLAAGHKVTAAQVQTWLRGLLMQLQLTNQRLLLSVQGSPGWADQQLGAIRALADNVIVISDTHKGTEVVAYSKTETLLGDEAQVVVMDLSTGINPDAICIASGLVKKGGLLALLSCAENQWNNISDQFGLWQDESRSSQYLFTNYFFNSLHQHANSHFRLIEFEALPVLNRFAAGQVTRLENGKTFEQQSVLRKLKSWVSDNQQPIALICADRGRGKSTCLGFLVRKLQTEIKLSVVVTAYAKQSAAILLDNCGECRFIAPDQLITGSTCWDILIVDEAAMLPHTMLNQLCKRFKKVVMATTVGGYEGSGQGFLLRFISRFRQDQVLRLDLRYPVRWAQNDLLEQWLDSALLLKPAENLSRQSDLIVEACKYRVLSHKEFSSDEVLVKKIYALMVSAHYRTRPSDLRMLMDNPDLSVIVAETGSDLVGIALLNREGGLDQIMSEQIFLGRRRPKGHLLAQMLTAQAGVCDFACYRGFRILRVAVIDSCRQKGIGRNLLSNAEAYARSLDMDYLGACFGFDANTSVFWRRVGFSLVHIGFGMGKSTGSHSIVVLRPLVGSLEKPVSDLQQKLKTHLAVRFCQLLRFMPVPEVIAIIRYVNYEAKLSHLEREEVRAFTRGYKGFELCFASLQKYLMQTVAKTRQDLQLPEWVIQKVIQNYDWEALSIDEDLVGRKQKQNKLRFIIGNLAGHN